ncbi:MAG: hypothetical protein WD490_08965 [Opitutales bacterium]
MKKSSTALPLAGFLVVLAATCSLCSASASETVLALEDFSGAIPDASLEPGNPAGWRAGPPGGSSSTAEPWFIRSDGGDQYLEFSGADAFDGNGRAYATREVSGVSTGPGNGWRVSVEFRIEEALFEGGGGQAFRFGLGGAAMRTLYLSSTLGGPGGNEFYLGDIGFTGSGDLASVSPTLRIFRFGGGASGGSEEIIESNPLQAGYLNGADTFRLILEGYYEEGGVRLTARIENLSGGGQPVTVSGFDSNPHAGTYFGLRHTSAAPSSPNRLDALTVRHDNFTVSAVTEPLDPVGVSHLYSQSFSAAAVDEGMESGNPTGWRAGPPAGSSSTDEPWFIRADGGEKYLEFSGAHRFDGNGRAYATTEVPGAPTVSGSGWRVSSDLAFDALTFGEGDNNFRFGVTGAAVRLLYLSSGGGGVGGNEFYLADFGFTAGENTGAATLAQATPTLRIYRFGGGESGPGGEVALSEPLPAGYLNTTDTYRLTLDGFYEEEGILLTARMENITGSGKTVTVSGIDPNPHRGAYFGYRHNSSPWFDVNQLAELIFRHDNFNVLATSGPLPEEAVGPEEFLPLIRPSLGISGGRLTISAAKPAGAEEFGWSVEVSNDLVNWVPGETTTDTGDEFAGRDIVEMDSANRRFIRLRLTGS